MTARDRGRRVVPGDPGAALHFHDLPDGSKQACHENHRAAPAPPPAPLREALERLVQACDLPHIVENRDRYFDALTQARAALAAPVGVPQEGLGERDEAHLRLLNDWEAARKIIVGLVDAFDARWTGTKTPPPIYYKANEWLERAMPGGFLAAAPAATGCPVCGQTFPHYHRDTADGEEIVRLPAATGLDVERLTRACEQGILNWVEAHANEDEADAPLAPFIAAAYAAEGEGT